MSHIFRASYSILHLWSKGLHEEAVQAYFKLERIETEAMRQGKNLHQGWALYIQENSRLPEELGGTDLRNPKVEVKLTATIPGHEEWLTLVGIVDCLDVDEIIEEKSGTTSSQTYAKTMQTPFYGLLCKLNGITVTRARIPHYNQHTKRTDTSYLWITPTVLSEAENWIITLAEEMHMYLENEGLYDLYEMSDFEEDLEIEVIEEEEL